MANFSDLPNELLLEIWNHVSQPKDIENFALVSKTIRTLAIRTLREHRKLTREFSKFHIGDPKSRVSAAGLLKEILTNPRVALYVKEITITKLHRCWEDEEKKGFNTLMAFDPEAGEKGGPYRHTPYMEKDMASFEQMAKRATQFFIFRDYPANAKYTVDYLIEQIESGHEAHVITLLVLLLTKLKSLMIEATEAGDEFFKALQYLSFGQGIKMLKRCVQVRILHIRDDRARRSVCWTVFNSFQRLESASCVIPEGMPHDCYLEFEISTWRSNVDGMLMLD